MQVAVPNTCQSSGLSLRAQGFVDAALGKLVLARDALGVDAQQHVHAVPGPLGHLGGIDAAVEPGGQAGEPQVVWPPGEGRGLLRRGERQLAGFGPGAAVGDRGQLAAPHTGEEAAIVARAEVRQMIAQKPGQLGMSGHDPDVALGPVLELPPLPRAAVVGPFAARIRGCTAEVQFAPVLVIRRVLPLAAFGVPYADGRITLSVPRLMASSGRSPA